MSFIKCGTCDGEISEEKCVFAIYKKNIDGKEYSFCCNRCADEFEKKQKK